MCSISYSGFPVAGCNLHYCLDKLQRWGDEDAQVDASYAGEAEARIELKKK